MKLSDTLPNGTIIKRTTSIKPFKGSPDKKNINLEIDLSGVSIEQLINRANGSSGTVVLWQNGGSGRSRYMEYTDGQTVKIDFLKPGEMSTEQRLEKEMASKSPEQRAEYIESLMKLAEKLDGGAE
jgi:hypothetical protein